MEKMHDPFFNKLLANIIRLTTGSLITKELTNPELIKK